MLKLEDHLRLQGFIEFGPNRDADAAPSGRARLHYSATTNRLMGSVNGGANSPVVLDADLITDSVQAHAREVDPGAAGGDIAARAIFVAPANGCTLTKVGIVPLESAAGIDNANTAVVAVADGAGNSIVSKTYNTATQPPAANVYESLGTLDTTHKVLTANEVVTLAITQGATADIGAVLIVIEWAPSA